MRKLILTFFILFNLCLQVFAEDLKFVQVSDIRYSLQNKQALTNFIKDINSLKNIDFVVFCGDNINNPNKEDLASFFKEAKKLNVPFYVILGEHDVNKNKKLTKKEYYKTLKRICWFHPQKTPNYSFEKNGIIFLIVDGSREFVNGTNGVYKQETLNWLDNKLSKSKQKNVIILQHFPIIPPAEKEMYYTIQPEKYLSIVSKYSNVKAIISGHFGVNKETKIKGINHISTASFPNYRIIDIVDTKAQEPIIWAEIK